MVERLQAATTKAASEEHKAPDWYWQMMEAGSTQSEELDNTGGVIQVDLGQQNASQPLVTSMAEETIEQCRRDDVLQENIVRAIETASRTLASASSALTYGPRPEFRTEVKEPEE